MSNSYFVSNRLVNKYTNKLYTCTPWPVMKASCFCVLWPWTKLKSLKMQKKKNIKAKQNYNNQQSQNKQTKTQGQYPAILTEETRSKKHLLCM